MGISRSPGSAEASRGADQRTIARRDLGHRTIRFYERHGFRLVTIEEKDQLLTPLAHSFGSAADPGGFGARSLIGFTKKCPRSEFAKGLRRKPEKRQKRACPDDVP